MSGWKPNPAASSDQRMAAIEVMLCEMLNRLFGNGQPGELDRMRADHQQLALRVSAVESASERTGGAAEEKTAGQSRFYVRATVVFAACELLIHSSWLKDVVMALIAGWR
jgi:hypothetical protein